MARGLRRFGLCGVVLAALAAAACPRKPDTARAPDAGTTPLEAKDVRCVERPEGCIWCEGKSGAPPLLDAEDTRPLLCHPKDEDDCVEFCSRLTPDCALEWRTGPSCLLASEEEFRRALFWRDADERPVATLIGRVIDDGGKRVEGAKVKIWYSHTPIAELSSGKDGQFRAVLRGVPAPYAIRVSHPGRATEILEIKLPADRPGDKAPSAPRAFRLGPESVVRGRVTNAAGDPLTDARVAALRSPEDLVDVGEGRSGEDGTFAIGGLDAGRKYYVRASKFGWATHTPKAPITAPGARVALKLQPTGVIRGQAVDEDGEGEPNATIVALASGELGTPTSPVYWTADVDGKFAEDRFALGTYYVAARLGEMLVYPPVKVLLEAETPEHEIKLALDHRGARVRGRVVPREGFVMPEDARVVLRSRSPLAFAPQTVAADLGAGGAFTASGILPGRYELSVRGGGRALGIAKGPRDVEVPIEAGTKVDLPEPIVVRPPIED